jgi:hypothetical protein
MTTEYHLDFSVRVDKISDFDKFFLRVETCLCNAKTNLAIVKLYRTALLANSYDLFEKNLSVTESPIERTLSL